MNVGSILQSPKRHFYDIVLILQKGVKGTVERCRPGRRGRGTPEDTDGKEKL